MKSPLLPAYLAAAFAKKLSRLALSVPPSGALVIIALIHNLLRRHPSINCLVHWVRLWIKFLCKCVQNVYDLHEILDNHSGACMQVVLSGVCLVIQPVSMRIYLHSLHDINMVALLHLWKFFSFTAQLNAF